MSKAQEFLEILRRPDQDIVKRELALFFGPRADVYLNTYDKFRTKSLAKNKLAMPITWHWGAFLGLFVWLCYRRLYIVAGILFVLAAGLVVLLGDKMSNGTAGAFVAMGALAKAMYVQHALGRIVKADKLQLANEERDSYLQRAGGVSLIAGLLAGAFFLAAIGIPIYELATTGRISR